MLETIKSTIINLINLKKTNLILSLDFESKSDIKYYISMYGEQILGIKLHSDIIDNFDDEFIDYLLDCSNLYNFIIIEDRKLCDIGKIANKQIKQITKYANLITCHGISGENMLKDIKKSCIYNNCGILLIAEMSCDKNLIDNNYTQNVINLANTYSDIVIGFISQKHLQDNFLHFTPGVSLVQDNNYNTPQNLIVNNNTDILIVGSALFKPNVSITDFIHINPNTINKINIKSTFFQSLEKFEIVKYGNFTLSSGKKSNIYFDIKKIISYPALLNEISEIIYKKISNVITPNTVIIGVPFGGIPIACYISCKYNIPMIHMRDKQKDYGTQNIIEGIYENKKCIVIEDVITTGNSALEFMDKLKNYVELDIIVSIICRTNAGINNIKNKGYKLEYIEYHKN